MDLCFNTNNIHFENIHFENVDMLSPLSDSGSPLYCEKQIPPPPDIMSFSKQVKPLRSFIRKFSDNTYDLGSIYRAIQVNNDNFRENLLYSICINAYYYDVLSKYPIYSKWIIKADQLKQLL